MSRIEVESMVQPNRDVVRRSQGFVPLLKRQGWSLFISLAILAMAFLTVLPFAWMISTSLKESTKVFVFPPQWIPRPIVWRNYFDALTVLPFGRFFLNSTIVSVVTTAGVLVTSSMAAYAFARVRFPYREQLFVLYLATMMIPGQILLIPRFLLMRYFDWVDTLKALIIPGLFSPFGTFLMRQFFMTIPVELEDAARIDGCSPFRIYLQIFLPLSKPAMGALGIFMFMGHWNDFIWPLVVINSKSNMTVTLGLSAFQGQYGTEWNLLMAASVIAVLPILVVFLIGQKQFISGITLTGLKG